LVAGAGLALAAEARAFQLTRYPNGGTEARAPGQTTSLGDEAEQNPYVYERDKAGN
jgi:hypothetical protein